MKKFISMFLAASMIISGGVFVNAKTDHEAIISHARECFDLPEDITDVDISQYGNEIGISWNDYENNRHYNLSADEHGCITSFYTYDESGSAESKLSREQAQAKADKLIKTIYGKNSDHIVFKKRSVGSGTFYAYYEVIKNGIPVDTSISVCINRTTGRVVNFNGPCTDIFGYEYTDPRSVKLLNDDQVYQNYKDSENIRLMYYLFYNYETRERTAKPVYVITPKDINAVTGEELKYEDKLYARGNVEEDAVEMTSNAAASKAAVTPAEKEAITYFNYLISEEEADDIVQKHFPAIKDFELTRSSTYKDGMNKLAVIELSYNKNEDERNYYASATLDAESGEILSFYRDDLKTDPDEKQNFDEKKAVLSAEKLFEELAPNEYKTGHFKQRIEYNTVYFDRIENGIPVNSQYVGVGFDNECNIVSYEKQWQKYDFPKTDKVSAERDVFENSKAGGERFGLIYRIVNETPVLVYAYNGSNWGGYIFDAFSGERINSYSGEPIIEENSGEYIDISGSPYQTTIETLAEYGYTLPYERFSPETPITVDDFYRFLGSEPVYTDSKRTYYSPSNALFTEAEGKQPLTKYNMAKIFVSDSGYSELAEKDIFKNPFTDIDDNDSGYAVIASALGLMPEKSGEFNGSLVITRGKAAEYILGCLAAKDML